MNIVFAILILCAPFAVSALLSWASNRNPAVRHSLVAEFGDPDSYRVRHDAEAVRSRFEHDPAWPVSSATGERR